MLGFDEIKLGSKSNRKLVSIDEISSKDIAIIGISLRLPKANSIQEMWYNLENGVDCIDEIPYDRKKDIEDYLDSIGLENNKRFYIQAGYLQDIDKFDYSFFKISPKEASLMDPNQRIFLETAWNAIEDAGYGGNKLVGSRTGIYVGFGSDRDYKKIIADVQPEALSLAVPGNIRPFIASRLSYLMDFKGPNMMIDTTCSSSLVSTHLACQAIKNGECDLAIAGGIQIHLLPFRDVDVGVASSDNRTRTFDFNSDGTGTGEGVIAILLKPLKKALIDRDNIYAVIKGSAVNHDGSSIGLTAPNAIAQEDVIVRAWKDAAIDPTTISNIEAHGTGTKLGDPIEIEGIQMAFKRYTDKKNFCAIGSIKSNIGHLDACAGLAGLVKTVLSLKYKKIPPTINFDRANQNIDFINSPVYINNKSSDWETESLPRRCGVSSFGLTGTNCHMIIEEAPEQTKDNIQYKNDFNILTLSAKSKEALLELIKNYRKFILNKNDSEISDICYISNTGRGHYNFRLAILVISKDDLIKKLDECINISLIKTSDIYYGIHNITSDSKSLQEEFQYTVTQIREFTLLANDLLARFVQFDKKDNNLIHQVINFYIRGAEIDWTILYEGEDRKKISIPHYPFDKKRAWVKILTNKNKINDNKKMYMGSTWKISDTISISKNILSDTILIIKDNGERGSNLANSLREKGAKVIEVDITDTYQKYNEHNYSIRLNQEDYTQLIKDVSSQNLSKIIHMQSLSNTNEISKVSELDEKLEYGVYSVFNLIKSLFSVNIKEKLEIFLVSDYVNEITKHETLIKPENATLFALGMVVTQEYQNLVCRCIDIDEAITSSHLIQEIYVEEGPFKVAYRDGKRYTNQLENLDIYSYEDRDINIKDNGVYIITGGLGGLGLEIANYLVSRQNNINVALISRSKLPERREWEAIIESNNDLKICDKIKTICYMENKGATIEYYSADVSDENGMTCVVNNLKLRYGRINGIVHCAGISGGGYIISKEKETFKRVLAPKVQGTLILSNLIKNDNLDFFILFSSAAAKLGGMGQSDYASANAYLDSFEVYMNRQGVNTVTINWSGWRDVGMAKDYGVNVDTLFKIMDTKSAIEAFENVINKKISNILIGEINYDYDLLKGDKRVATYFSPEIKMEIEKKLKARIEKIKLKELEQSVNLKGKESYTNIEKQIAQIWKEVLGFEELNINDNFFEIGGDSIMIIKVHESLEAVFPGKVTVTDLFAYPTILKLSEYIDSKNDNLAADYKETIKVNKTDLKDDILELFDKVEQGEMSIEVAMKYFNKMEDQP